MKVKILKTKDRVKTLLTEHPHLRDNDERLIANIWNQDMDKLGFNTEHTSAKFLLRQFAEGRLTNPESVRRTRQKIQQHNIELRGNTFVERGNRQEEIVNELEQM